MSPPKNPLFKVVLLSGALVAITAPLCLANESLFREQNNETLISQPNQRLNDQHSLELFSPNLLEIVDTCLTRLDSLHEQVTVAQLDHQNLVTQIHAKPYMTTLTHWYDEHPHPDNLTKWAGPLADQELCLHQLEQLNGRVERQYEEKSNGNDLNLYLLLDTYGQLSNGKYLGNSEWPGEYKECLRLKINSTEGLLATRYCSGAFKRNKWPKEGKLNQLLSQRAGICLPKSCDSTKYKNKFELIEKLVKFKTSEVEKSAYYLDYLYCLPDEQSTLRLWYYSPKTVAFVGAVSAWIALLVFATFRYKSLMKSSSSSSAGDGIVGLYKLLSLTENVKSLFSVTLKKKEASASKEDKVVNLDVVEGIKVIAMCYVVTAHALLGFSLLISNGREMSYLDAAHLLFLSTYMTPSFAVNVFFSITGLLTAYLLFKHSKSSGSLVKPSNWLAFIALRYIRIMPLYILIVMYEKYLAKYTGSGPFWDYGTSSLGTRWQCEQESWLWTLLFGANFKGPLEHCIPSAWYLANDFHFALVAPIFLALIQKRPKIGKIVLVGATLLAYLSTVVKLVTSSFDLRPIHQFRLDGFISAITSLGDIYTQPQYRIPAYLCGLFMGHALYKYEQAKLLALKEGTIAKKRAEWPKWMSRYFKLASPAFCSILMVPILGHLLRGSEFYTKVSFGCLLPTYNLLFGFTAGLYILLASTGHGNQTVNKFLASPMWKPFSRLSLSVLLINIEVFNYFAQTSTHLLYFDFKTFAALNLFSIVMSYSVAAVVCVLFESPLRNLINKYLVTWIKLGSKKRNKLGIKSE